MKKYISIGLLAFGISQIALAKPLPTDQKGDPKKENQTPAFSLSSGYFSLFNFFQEHPVMPTGTDTLKVNIPQQKESEKKPSHK